MSRPPPPVAAGPATTEVTVIGAGVIGLSTGIRLAEAGHAVRILTADAPAATTSAAATAMVGLAFAEPMDRVPGWEAATLAELELIRRQADGGVRTERCLLGSRSSNARPPGIAAWPGYGDARSGELPAGFPFGFWLTMTVVDMTRYLPYLVERFRAAGGTLERRTVQAFNELANAALVVNCSGLGARALAEDDSLTGEWGMHVVVANPGISHAFMEGPPGEREWVAWMPHGDRVLIGGVVNPHQRDPGPDAATGERLLRAAAAAHPTLSSAPVIGYNSGIRPVRPAVRVEEVRRGGPGRLIHNYGHGSLGVTLSWGCADAVTAMVCSPDR